MSDLDGLKKAGDDLAKTVKEGAGPQYKVGEGLVKVLMNSLGVKHFTTDVITALIAGISFGALHSKESITGIVVGVLINMKNELEEKKKSINL